MKYDVIIVGAGPAGSSAAYLLASAGMRVALLDQYAFPRDKLCGGLLSGRSQRVFTEIFGASWSPTIEYLSHGVTMYHRDRLLNALEDASPLHFTSRSVFDAHLLQLAEQQGATFLQANVSGLDRADNTVYLKDGQQFQADFIIGADGVLSTIANSLYPRSLDKRRLGLAMEIELPRETITQDVTMPEIYFGLVQWGYGWVFPKAETLTVGVGGVWQKNPSMLRAFQEFLKQRFGFQPDVRIKGHYLPFRVYRRKPGNGSVLLVGDAAGLVEPITGEGIAFAMQSGQFAASSILDAAKQGNPSAAFACYRPRYQHFVKMFDIAHLMGYFLFPRPMEILFTKLLPKSQSALRRQIELLADDISYEEFFGMMLRWLLKSARIPFLSGK